MQDGMAAMRTGSNNTIAIRIEDRLSVDADIGTDE